MSRMQWQAGLPAYSAPLTNCEPLYSWAAPKPHLLLLHCLKLIGGSGGTSACGARPAEVLPAAGSWKVQRG